MFNLKHDDRNPTSDFLHRNPSLYDRIFETSSLEICTELFEEILGKKPDSLIDIGCGTGRDVYELSLLGISCVGVDFVPTMVEHAKSKYDKLEFLCGDLKTLRLNRKFDVVTILGSCINYMLSNSELNDALESTKRLCNDGALVVIEPLNVSSFIGSATPPKRFEVEVDDVKATGIAKYNWHSVDQIIERNRKWSFSDTSEVVTDSYKLRLILAQDLKSFLYNSGFCDVSILSKQRSKIYGESIFVTARLR